MSSYRFCRTDDIALLVDALNRCWAPHFPDEPPMTAAAFKRSIRDLQVWCSSCMVAFAGADPIGVLIGAKRSSATLIHKIAVHPDHQRQGHGSHLLASLSSKLAILGPPRIVAEVSETLGPGCELFGANGYADEARLTDYVLQPIHENVEGIAGRFLIPVTVDDLAANGLLGDASQPVCWEHSVQTLNARKDEVSGLAVASEDRIEASALYIKDGAVLHLRSFVNDDGARLKQLLARIYASGVATVSYSKVHPTEISREMLERLGFRAVGTHRQYAATLRQGSGSP